MRDIIVCLADVTGIMAAPWVRNGYRALLVDPQHPAGVTEDGSYIKVGHPVDHPVTWDVLRWAQARAVFVAGFPVCTDLAVSGTAHWQAKRERERESQISKHGRCSSSTSAGWSAR